MKPVTAVLPVIVAAVLLALASCMTVTPTVVSEAVDASESRALWERHRAQMSGISGWHIRGKMAVHSNAPGGAKGGNATLVWEYNKQSQVIELYGPFGSGRVRINESAATDTAPAAALLKDTKGNITRGENASQVLYQKLGWRVPFAAFAKLGSRHSRRPRARPKMGCRRSPKNLATGRLAGGIRRL